MSASTAAQASVDPTAWVGATVLVTGVCGSIGSELLRQLLAAGVERVVGLDNNESALFAMRARHRGDPRVGLLLGDVRSRETLFERMQGADIVLHTAALKHVELCEQSPREAVETNVRGVQNVIEAAARTPSVRRVIFTSSDKAVNPTSVMGTSKLMGERLFTAAAEGSDGSTIFASTRFGNVLGSRGSVVPTFRRQIAQGGPVTLTDPRMSRFVMTVKQAVALVMRATFLARGGEVYVTKMPCVAIPTLAEVMIAHLAPLHGHAADRIVVEEIGPRPGEKLYEELLNTEEVRRSVELEDYFVVQPPFSSAAPEAGSPGRRVDRPYSSALEPILSSAETAAMLREAGLLDAREAPCES